MDKVCLIDAANDVSAFASRDAERYILNGVHCNGKGTEATNGHVLLRVPYVGTPVEEFPVVNASNDREPAIIPLKAFTEALKNAGTKHRLPVLNCVRVSTVKRGDTLKVQLTTTDLDSTRLVETKAIEGKYPDVDQVVPTGPPTFTITISAEILKLIADYAMKHGKEAGGGSPVLFEFIEPDTPFRFSVRLNDLREAKGVASPMRMN